MRRTRKFLPETCLIHTGGYTVLSYSTADELDLVDYKMTTYHCGVEECNEPLGWEHEGPNQRYLCGPGAPPRELVEFTWAKKLAQEKMYVIGMTVFASALSTLIPWTISLQLTGDIWSVFATITVGGWVVIAAVITGLVTWVMRRRETTVYSEKLCNGFYMTGQPLEQKKEI